MFCGGRRRREVGKGILILCRALNQGIIVFDLDEHVAHFHLVSKEHWQDQVTTFELFGREQCRVAGISSPQCIEGHMSLLWLGSREVGEEDRPIPDSLKVSVLLGSPLHVSNHPFWEQCSEESGYRNRPRSTGTVRSVKSQEQNYHADQLPYVSHVDKPPLGMMQECHDHCQRHLGTPHLISRDPRQKGLGRLKLDEKKLKRADVDNGIYIWNGGEMHLC